MNHAKREAFKEVESFIAANGRNADIQSFVEKKICELEGASATDESPIGLMYRALMEISCADPDELGVFYAAKIRQISDTALRRMNSEYTAKVQKALGIE